MHGLSGLIGRKIGMSQVFAENGDAVPVTVIEAGPCYVTQVKTLERDGYEAAQIGFEAKKEKQTTRPLQGHFKKAKVQPQRIVREVAVEDIEACEPGQVVGANIFETGELGQSATPSKVFKGTRMGGRMGNKRVTVRNLQVVGVDAEKNILLVKGAVPGHRNGYVLINRAG